MMAFACCRSVGVGTTDDDDMITPRKTRGLVLRSWRGAQQTEQQLAEKSPPSPRVIEPILPSPREAMVLAGLPISMRLALLQRLTGYDKRTPNSKAFLGMRGKKSSIWSTEDNAQKEEDLPDSLLLESGEGDNSDDDLDALLYGHVPEKKKERFLGMRGKKMSDGPSDPLADPVALPYWRERYVFQQPFQQVVSKKRAPSSNSFMGMRGKRSDSTKPIEDNNLADEHVGREESFIGSPIPPRYEERLIKTTSIDTCCSY